MNNFGVERFLEHFIAMAPAPTNRLATSITDTEPKMIAATHDKFSGFVLLVE